MTYLTTSQIGLPIMEAFGFKPSDGIVSMTLRLTVGSLPVLTVEQYVKDGEGKVAGIGTAIKRYELVEKR